MDWINLAIKASVAVGTITLAIVAIWQDKIRAWVSKPELDIDVEMSPRDCHKTFITKRQSPLRLSENGTDCYYLRIRVKNEGNRRAEMVEVFVADLLKKQADGTFKRVESFMPMDLLWSHIRKPFFDIISPGMEKHCDVGHIIDPAKNAEFGYKKDPGEDIQDKTWLSLDLEVKPNTMSHLLEPGIYRLTLLIASSNTKPIEKTLEINHTGEWFSDETKMLSEGVGLKIVD